MTENVHRRAASYLALLLLLYVALPSFVLSVLLLFHAGSPRLAYAVSLALLAGFAFYHREKFSVRDWGVLLAILLFCHFFAYAVLDSFFDGLAYHQPAAARIAKGFNPVYDGYMDLGRPADTWSDQATYFPKAAWYFAAAVTAAWGDLQTGKAYHLLLLSAALLFIWDTTREDRLPKRVLWLAACLNPVALGQATGYLQDGALATLSAISIFYACLFFRGKPIPRLAHFFCLVSLAMLFCVKMSGFGYGCIVLFFIVLHRFVRIYRETPAAFSGRFLAGCKAALLLSLKAGIPVFSLVFVWGFAPYVTNVSSGRHIFYPLVRGGGGAEEGGFSLEMAAQAIYPNAHNRFTRLLYSVASRPTETDRARLKNPLDIFSLADWQDSSPGDNMRAGGLGPIFCLICLLSVSAAALFRFRGCGWPLFLLLTLLFAHPYAWQMRYAPFLWLLPPLCLLSVPEAKIRFLWGPVSLALVNALGVTYFSLGYDWAISQDIVQICAPHAGEAVLLDRTIFEYDGIFARFGLRPKYVNPEETNFYRYGANLGLLARDRTSVGVNIFFAEDILPAPEMLVLAEEAALPYLNMSEGLIPVRTSSRKLEWRTYADKVKLYMSIGEELQNDWELTLKGSSFGSGPNAGGLSALIFVNNRRIGEWRIGPDSQTASFVIPGEVLEESRRDETRLVTLMLRLPEVPTLVENNLEPSAYGLRLEEIGVRPRENGKRL